MLSNEPKNHKEEVEFGLATANENLWESFSYKMLNL